MNGFFHNTFGMVNIKTMKCNILLDIVLVISYYSTMLSRKSLSNLEAEKKK